MQVELLEWDFWHGAELQLGPAKFVEILLANFGLAYKTFL